MVSLCFLAACQADGTASDVLGSAKDQASSAPVNAAHGPLAEGQTLGKGQTKVGMLLALSASGQLGEHARSMRDGAKFAIEDFAGSLVSLTIMDTGNQVGRAQAGANKMVSSGVVAIIGPVDPQSTLAVAAITSPKSVPLLLLDGENNGKTGIYAVAMSEADSASSGARAIAQLGSRIFALALPAGPKGDVIGQRVQSGLANSGAVVAISVRYGPDASSVASAVSTLATSADGADALLVAAGDFDPRPLLIALRALPGGGTKRPLIGTNKWEDFGISDRLFDGAYIATIDPD